MSVCPMIGRIQYFLACSFMGSTNMSSFLNDKTGSVRWLCFELMGPIDFSYKKEVAIADVWSQAYHLAYNDPDFNPELTVQDVNENEERNQKYTKMTTEQELIARYYEKSTDQKDFVTATDIMVSLNCLNIRISQINLTSTFGLWFQKINIPNVEFMAICKTKVYRITL